MSRTLTIRLTQDLADWLEQTSEKTGIPQGRIIRDHLEHAKARSSSRGYRRLAGAVDGPRDLSSRKGFSRT